MPWVKLKRWVDVFLKRRRREWKLQCALQSLGVQRQMAGLMGGGGGETVEEMSDAERVAAFTAAGFRVETRHTD